LAKMLFSTEATPRSGLVRFHPPIRAVAARASTSLTTTVSCHESRSSVRSSPSGETPRTHR
jgi:hypothetical protein